MHAIVIEITEIIINIH